MYKLFFGLILLVLLIGQTDAQTVSSSCNVNNYRYWEVWFRNSSSHWMWCQFRCEADQSDGVGRASACSAAQAIPPVQENGGVKHLILGDENGRQLRDEGMSYGYECKQTRKELAQSPNQYCRIRNAKPNQAYIRYAKPKNHH